MLERADSAKTRGFRMHISSVRMVERSLSPLQNQDVVVVLLGKQSGFSGRGLTRQGAAEVWGLGLSLPSTLLKGQQPHGL